MVSDSTRLESLRQSAVSHDLQSAMLHDLQIREQAILSFMVERHHELERHVKNHMKLLHTEAQLASKEMLKSKRDFSSGARSSQLV